MNNVIIRNMATDDLSIYDGDVEHDMWVDFDNYENTGFPDVFNEDEDEIDYDEAEFDQ